jgi:RNA recognition motif-containing protein
VHNQSKELERLQQEKQDIEHQIADLFTFYSKHKASLDRAKAFSPGGLLVNPYLSRSRTEGKPSKAAKALPVDVVKASSARSHRQVYGDHNYYKFAPGGPLPYPLEPY